MHALSVRRKCRAKLMIILYPYVLLQLQIKDDLEKVKKDATQTYSCGTLRNIRRYRQKKGFDMELELLKGRAHAP